MPLSGVKHYILTSDHRASEDTQMGRREVAVGNGTCCQAWRPELHPWSPHGGEESESPPRHPPTLSPCTPWHVLQRPPAQR